jgi:peptidoglycan/xylan/chitin deacetylase (PgdA/CDA1 family)
MEVTADGEEVMGAQELRDLPRDLIRIGSHSAHHPHMANLADAEALAEFRDSKAALEDVMGETVDLFAYPHGNRSPRTDDLAAQAGYRHVFSVVPEAIPAGRTAVLRGRDPTYPTDPMWVFRMKVQGAFGWIPVASRLKRRLTGRSRGSRLEG